jgi:hypothetical protein
LAKRRSATRARNRRLSEESWSRPSPACVASRCGAGCYRCNRGGAANVPIV